MFGTLIGVFSDSHNNLHNLKNAAERAKTLGAKVFFHLGDTYKDAEVLNEYSKKVFCVPGLYEKEYADPKIDNHFFTEVAGFNIFVTHSEKLEPQDLPGSLDPKTIAINNEADIYLYGHTHLYEAMIKGDTLFLNPGHLKTGDNRSETLSFGMLELTEKKAIGRVYGLDGKILQETVLLKF